MCIIIHRPVENSLSMGTLEARAKANRDGWGIMMYSDEAGIITHRGMKFEEFVEVYESLPKDVEMAIHFRIKTHGEINLANTHPFEVLSKEKDGEEMWLMHNGMMPIKCTNPKFSDTWHWVNLILTPLMQNNSKLLELSEFRFILDAAISNSRVLILDDAGKYTFLNESDWKVNYHEKDGCKYSTTVPKDWTKTTTNIKSAGQSAAATGGTKDTTEHEYHSGPYGQRWKNNGYYMGVSREEVEDLEEDSKTVVVGGGSANSGTTSFRTETTPAATTSTGTNVTVLPGQTVRDRTKESSSQTQKHPKIITNGGEDSEAGLRRFPVRVVGDSGLTQKQLRELYDLEEAEYYKEDNDGIYEDLSSPIGLDFDNQRAYLLTESAENADELETFDESIFMNAQYQDIFAFVRRSPEEAALFLYKRFS